MKTYHRSEWNDGCPSLARQTSPQTNNGSKGKKDTTTKKAKTIHAFCTPMASANGMA